MDFILHFKNESNSAIVLPMFARLSRYELFPHAAALAKDSAEADLRFHVEDILDARKLECETNRAAAPKLGCALRATVLLRCRHSGERGGTFSALCGEKPGSRQSERCSRGRFGLSSSDLIQPLCHVFQTHVFIAESQGYNSIREGHTRLPAAKLTHLKTGGGFVAYV